MLDPAWTIPFYTPSSPAFYATLGAGAVLMLFFNSPGRNPFVNFGLGLWDTYNNLTGILSDVLSYIRLFAIGLSGGILATVFNALADGFVPEGRTSSCGCSSWSRFCSWATASISSCPPSRRSCTRCV